LLALSKAIVMRFKLKDVLKKEESKWEKNLIFQTYLVTLVAYSSQANLIRLKLKDGLKKEEW